MNRKDKKYHTGLSGLSLVKNILVMSLCALLLIQIPLGCGKKRAEKSVVQRHSGLSLKHGDLVPTFETVDIHGNAFDMQSIAGSTILLEFLNFSAFHDNPAYWKYSNVLAEKYKDQNFVSVLVLNDKGFNKSKVRETIEESGVKASIFLMPPDKMDDLFGQKPGSVALVLIDSNSVIRFAKHTLLPNDTRRQLVEKHVLGGVKYTFNEEETFEYPFKLDQRVPDLRLERIDTDETMKLREVCQRPMLCLLFTATCTQCEITKFLNALQEIKEHLKGEITWEDMIILFREDLTKDKLSRYLDEYQVGIPAFQTADLDKLTSSYVTRKTAILRPKAILVDESGTIRYLKNLSDFKREIEAKSIDLQALRVTENE